VQVYRFHPLVHTPTNTRNPIHIQRRPPIPTHGVTHIHGTILTVSQIPAPRPLLVVWAGELVSQFTKMRGFFQVTMMSKQRSKRTLKRTFGSTPVHGISKFKMSSKLTSLSLLGYSRYLSVSLYSLCFFGNMCIPVALSIRQRSRVPFFVHKHAGSQS